MKYLIINGSPTRHNTWQLAMQAKEHILETDKSAEFDEIQLSDEKLPFCLGCSSCFRLGGEKCPHYSVIGKIITAIDNADGIIVCSTCYNMNMTSILKNVFDHLCYMLHRPHFFTKKALVLSTTGGIGANKAVRKISDALCGIGFNRCYEFSCSSYSWNCYKPTQKQICKLSKTVDKFTTDVASNKIHSPKASLLIPYNMFRGMSVYYTKDSKYPTADADYYGAEDRKKTLYDKRVPVPFYKRPVGHLFHFMGKSLGARITVTYKKSEAAPNKSVEKIS